jgi:hypothetical protein
MQIPFMKVLSIRVHPNLNVCTGGGGAAVEVSEGSSNACLLHGLKTFLSLLPSG